MAAALAGICALRDLVRDVGIFRHELAAAGTLAIAGVLITRSDRTLVSKQVESEARVYERAVPISVKFREAYARGVPLVHYDRFGPGAAAYRAAAEAFLAGGAGSRQRAVGG